MDAILQQKPKRKLYDGELDDEYSERQYDPLVASVMEEQQAKKRAKQTSAGGFVKGKKGLTLEEVEEQEGGTVKESKIGMAATMRAEGRKNKGSKDETGLLGVDEMVVAEEALEQEEDDGNKLEAFNLEQERQEGHFDEAGNYVEHKEDDDPTMQDAWLTSEDAKVVSDEVRRKVEQNNARMQAAEEAPMMTPLQSANLMRQIIAHLQPRETVNKALRRLRPKQDPKPKSRRGAKQEQAATADSLKLSNEAQESKRIFDEITESAMALMDAGELDIYSMPAEDLQERAARYPAEADDLDIFGDFEPAKPNDAPQPSSVDASALNIPVFKPIQQNGHQQEPQQVQHQNAAVDYSTWPIKELTRFLRERGVDTSGITEKEDLIQRVTVLASQGPEGADEAVGVAPQGYVWDPISSYYFSPETNMYYDPSTEYYFSSSDGKWYYLDSFSNKFSEIKTEKIVTDHF